MNQNEWVINHFLVCGSGLHRLDGLGVRQGGTGGLSGLDQQPTTLLSSRSPDGSWDVLSPTQMLKTDTDCHFLFKECIFFLDDVTRTLEKREEKYKTVLSSRLSPPSFFVCS